MFLGFTNFYQQFIQSFNNLIAAIILILKTTKSFDKSASILIRVNINEIVGNSDSLKPILSKSKKAKMAKSKNLVNLTKSQIAVTINNEAIGFLIFEATIAFIKLKEVFIKTLIL